MKKLVTFVIVLAFLVTTVAPLEANAAEKKVPTAGECMMKYAKKYRGSRYKLGGTHLKNLKKKGDRNRVDCVGFVCGIVRRYGNIKMRGSNMKKTCRKYGFKVGTGRKVVNKCKPGDILLYTKGNHVAFYYGKKGGRHYLIDASMVTYAVSIRKIPRGKHLTAYRIEKGLQKKSKKYKKLLAKYEKKKNLKVAAAK